MISIIFGKLSRNGQSWSKLAYRRYSSSSSNPVRIIEVGPRDGLQNIKQLIPTATKIELIKRLAGTGLRTIEATSFVSPKWVPQLADSKDVLAEIRPRDSHTGFPVLVPNLKGLENAYMAGAKEITVFASATEAFSQANQACSIDEALNQAEDVTKQALKLGMTVRGATSCIFSGPFSGPTPPEDVLAVVQRFLAMGCLEVGLGDTLGVGTPKDTETLLNHLLRYVPADKLAGHFHDTYGQGIGNIVKAYEMGIRTFESSVAGLGGCPYAPGAKGNVATEDVIYTLEKMGINTGVNLDELVSVGQWISKELGHPNESRVGVALASKYASSPTVTTDPAHKGQKNVARSWAVIEDKGEYLVSRSGTSMKITLCRPRNGNALTIAMLKGLTDLFRGLAHDPSVFHVIIESKGKFFCTGMDLSGGTNTADMSGESYYSKVLALYDAIEHAPQTTIALVDGPCFGGGVGLTFVCDVRLVSSRACWTLSEVKIGVSPAIISKYLVREWGASLTREGMISGREIGADELFRVGAVHAVCDDLDTKLNDYLDQLQKCAPRSAAINKELTRLGWYDPEGQAQAKLIERTFGDMMAPGSEGEYGIGQFQKKTKNFSWEKFWEGRSYIDGLDFNRTSPRKPSDGGNK